MRQVTHHYKLQIFSFVPTISIISHEIFYNYRRNVQIVLSQSYSILLEIQQTISINISIIGQMLIKESRQKPSWI